MRFLHFWIVFIQMVVEIFSKMSIKRILITFQDNASEVAKEFAFQLTVVVYMSLFYFIFSGNLLFSRSITNMSVALKTDSERTNCPNSALSRPKVSRSRFFFFFLFVFLS